MKQSALRRSLLCFLACALAFSVLAGCGNDGESGVIIHSTKSSDEGKTTLSFFGYKADAENLTAIEGALQDFMAENKDIEISYEGIKGEDYWNSFDKRDAANSLDDVFMMHHDHVISMKDEGKLADLSGLAGLDNFTDEAKAQFVGEDGSIYFLPTQISTYNLYVNYDLLKKHGQSVPTNWSEFQQTCDYFAGKGITPVIANNRNSFPTIIQGKGLFDFYQQPAGDVTAGLSEFNEDPALFAEQLAPGVELAAEMIERGWVDCAEVLDTGQTSDDLGIFLEGERPFMLTGGWASNRVMSMNPSFSYGVCPYPILEDGSVLPMQIDTCISVNANSPHRAEAEKFVEYLIEPDVMWEYCDEQASYSPLKDGRIPTERTLAPSVDYLSNGRTVLRAEYRLTLPTEVAITACSRALLNGASVDEAQSILVQELSK